MAWSAFLLVLAHAWIAVAPPPPEGQWADAASASSPVSQPTGSAAGLKEEEGYFASLLASPAPPFFLIGVAYRSAEQRPENLSSEKRHAAQNGTFPRSL
jgi:hypothetical protein